MLKKITTIFLILLLTFHWYGYRLVTTYMVKVIDRQMEVRLDANDYDESDLVEIRIPLQIPYQQNSSDFERHYGEIEINGQVYSYVKRKIEDGTLVLKCISNIEKQTIRNADHDFFQINNGLDRQPTKNSNCPLTKGLKNSSPDYEIWEEKYELSSLDLSPITKSKTKISLFDNPNLPVPGEPPKFI